MQLLQQEPGQPRGNDNNREVHAPRARRTQPAASQAASKFEFYWWTIEFDVASKNRWRMPISNAIIEACLP